jgi:hypothetical protein
VVDGEVRAVRESCCSIKDHIRLLSPPHDLTLFSRSLHSQVRAAFPPPPSAQDGAWRRPARARSERLALGGRHNAHQEAFVLQRESQERSFVDFSSVPNPARRVYVGEAHATLVGPTQHLDGPSDVRR